MLVSLQMLRGIAASLVLLYHLNGSIFGKAKYFPEQAWAGLGFGHAGVDLFFVLSGFVIFFAHSDDIGRSEQAGRYLVKRLTRIYPVYWVVLCAIVPVYFVFPSFGFGHERDPVQIITSIFLVPMPADPVLNVAWTLRHEMLFYCLFALAILNRRAGWIVLGSWWLGCAIWMAMGDGGFPGRFLFAQQNLLFLLGIACAAVSRPVPFPALMVIGGVLAFCLTGAVEVAGMEMPLASLAYGVGAALVILGLVTLERAGRLRPAWPLRVLGDASYSLYLVHFPALSFGAKLLFSSGIASEAPHAVSFTLLLVAALAAGLGCHYLVERPLLRWLRPRGGRSSKSASPARQAPSPLI